MSTNKAKRMKRIFAMQTRKEEQHRARVASARAEVDEHRAGLEALEGQIESAVASSPTGKQLDLATVQFGRLLIESGMRASEHRRVLLDESIASLDAEFAAWQAERQRAKSLEKVVDRLTTEAAAEAAKADEAQIEELSLARRAKSNA